MAGSGKAEVNARSCGLRGVIDRNDDIHQTRAVFQENMLVSVFLQIGSRYREHVHAVIIGHIRWGHQAAPDDAAAETGLGAGRRWRVIGFAPKNG